MPSDEVQPLLQRQQTVDVIIVHKVHKACKSPKSVLLEGSVAGLYSLRERSHNSNYYHLSPHIRAHVLCAPPRARYVFLTGACSVQVARRASAASCRLPEERSQRLLRRQQHDVIAFGQTAACSLGRRFQEEVDAGRIGRARSEACRRSLGEANVMCNADLAHLVPLAREHRFPLVFEHLH